LSLANCPSGNQHQDRQQYDTIATSRHSMSDYEEVLLGVRLGSLPQQYARYGAEHTRDEAVLLYAQAGEVYEAAA
jgi:hypothetical protein